MLASVSFDSIPRRISFIFSWIHLVGGGVLPLAVTFAANWHMLGRPSEIALPRFAVELFLPLPPFMPLESAGRLENPCDEFVAGVFLWPRPPWPRCSLPSRLALSPFRVFVILPRVPLSGRA